ncbi:unnamed protein product [Arctia plantaginis]|uniref:Lipase n=1 Tax=Arctia plantaginis TaxID=874455 RepID=A0A8S0ZXU8_ARCPL|nr:unnamed protein product [Arctia plantaginis]
MFVKLLLVCAVCVCAQARNPFFETGKRIAADGFPAETHYVTTSDGYILEIHRIPHGRRGDSTAKRPVVFLMHGLLGASNNYIGLGVNNSLAYNLADEGFDVWMGNARGNYNSRRHIKLDPDHIIQKHDFFDFTFEEIAIIDLPAMIDYALDYTGNQQLYYIGHSQGGTVFLVLMALKPEYNRKIAAAHLMAGVGYQKYFPNGQLKTAARFVDTIYSLSKTLGIVELYPELLMPSTFNGYRTADYCTGDPKQKDLCELYGVDHILRSDSSLDSLMPAGASLKQAAHYGQNIRDKRFRRYDHGSITNLINYRSLNPPQYDLSLIDSDVTMHYSLNDNLLDERDVLEMAADMPNTKVRKVARESFEHVDYVVAPDAKELVTDYIIKALKNTPIKKGI